jgi:hypothetical protein
MDNNLIDRGTDEFQRHLKLPLSERIASIIGEHKESSDLDSIIVPIVRRLVVNITIMEMGGEVVTPDQGSRYIETEGFDKKVSALAEDLDVAPELHSYNPEREIEQLAIEKLYSLRLPRQGRYEWELPSDSVSTRLNKAIISGNLAESIRRSVIETGLLIVRGGEKAKAKALEESEPIG